MLHDPKRVRKLQRKVEDMKRRRRLYRLLFTAIPLLYAVFIGMTVYGFAHDIQPLQPAGLLPLIFGTFGLIAWIAVHFGDRRTTPFQDVRDAERALEDYYDEVGYTL